MNAKTKTAMAVDAIMPTSIKDAAYKFARAGETSASIARYIVDNDPSFPDEVSKELKADLNAGFMLRATELWGDEFYKIGDGGTYIPMGNSIVLKNVAPEKSIRIGLSYCFAMSQQEFGQLKNNFLVCACFRGDTIVSSSDFSLNIRSTVRLQSKTPFSDF